MSGENVSVTVQILDKEYTVACPEDEKDALLRSARELNERMRRLRDGGKVLGAERMAVMTALNLVHEHSELVREREAITSQMGDTIRRLEDKIATVVGRRRPVEPVD